MEEWCSGCVHIAEVQTRLVALLIGVYDDAELSLESWVGLPQAIAHVRI